MSSLSLVSSQRIADLSGERRAKKSGPAADRRLKAARTTGNVEFEDWSSADLVSRNLCGSFPSSFVLGLRHVTAIDISRNFISAIDTTAMWAQLPALRRLNLADNMISNLAYVAGLGLCPLLEDLDLRGNPCRPGGGRITLLAMLLVPKGPCLKHLSSISGNVAAAKLEAAAVVAANRKAGLPSTLQELQNRGLQSSQRVNLKDLKADELRPARPRSAPSTPCAPKKYRERHLQSCEEVLQAEQTSRRFLAQLREACASNRLQEIRHLSKSWKPQHPSLILRRVGSCCLPRAHIFQAPLAQGGVGVASYFSQLAVFDGHVLTVQDLEDAVTATLELLQETPTALPKSEQAEEKKKLEAMKPRFYSPDFEKWRIKTRSRAQNVDVDDDSDEADIRRFHALHVPDVAHQKPSLHPGSSFHVMTRFKAVVRVSDLALQMRDAAEETQALNEAEISLWKRLTSRAETSRNEEQKESESESEEVRTENGFELARQIPQDVLNLPTAAPLPVKKQLDSAVKGGVQVAVASPVPLDMKLLIGQSKRLLRAYQSSSAPELPKAVKSAVAQSDDSWGFTAESIKLRQKKAQETDTMMLSKAGVVMERLRRKGIAQAAPVTADAAAVARVQWMRQLAEDFPEEFARAKNEDPRICLREEAILASSLYVCALHGDPRQEKDWEMREVWLSLMGCLWLGDRAGGAPSLLLGGASVADVLVAPARQGVDTTAFLGTSPLHAFSIEFPGARFTRKKYLASEDKETMEKWVATCAVLDVRRAKNADHQQSASQTQASQTPLQTPHSSVMPTSSGFFLRQSTDFAFGSAPATPIFTSKLKQSLPEG